MKVAMELDFGNAGCVIRHYNAEATNPCEYHLNKKHRLYEGDPASTKALSVLERQQAGKQLQDARKERSFSLQGLLIRWIVIYHIPFRIVEIAGFVVYSSLVPLRYSVSCRKAIIPSKGVIDAEFLTQK